MPHGSLVFEFLLEQLVVETHDFFRLDENRPSRVRNFVNDSAHFRSFGTFYGDHFALRADYWNVRFEDLREVCVRSDFFERAFDFSADFRNRVFYFAQFLQVFERAAFFIDDFENLVFGFFQIRKAFHETRQMLKFEFDFAIENFLANCARAHAKKSDCEKLIDWKKRALSFYYGKKRLHFRPRF